MLCGGGSGGKYGMRFMLGSGLSRHSSRGSELVSAMEGLYESIQHRFIFYQDTSGKVALVTDLHSFLQICSLYEVSDNALPN